MSAFIYYYVIIMALIMNIDKLNWMSLKLSLVLK